MSRAMLRSADRPLSLVISSVDRRRVMGERIEEELEATLAVLPDQAQQIGFYSPGELSFSLTTISER